MLDESNLSYLAGLFDGKGCIQIIHSLPQKGKRTEQHTLICTVNNTEQEAAKYYHIAFGGRVNFKKSNNPNHKNQWTWAISSNQAKEFLDRIKPYLRLKLDQAECAIAFQSFRANVPYRKGYKWRSHISVEELEKRDWYYLELKRLKDSHFPARHHRIRASKIDNWNQKSIDIKIQELLAKGDLLRRDIAKEINEDIGSVRAIMVQHKDKFIQRENNKWGLR